MKRLIIFWSMLLCSALAFGQKYTSDTGTGWCRMNFQTKLYTVNATTFKDLNSNKTNSFRVRSSSFNWSNYFCLDYKPTDVDISMTHCSTTQNYSYSFSNLKGMETVFTDDLPISCNNEQSSFRMSYSAYSFPDLFTNGQTHFYQNTFADEIETIFSKFTKVLTVISDYAYNSHYTRQLYGTVEIFGQAWTSEWDSKNGKRKSSWDANWRSIISAGYDYSGNIDTYESGAHRYYSNLQRMIFTQKNIHAFRLFVRPHQQDEMSELRWDNTIDEGILWNLRDELLDEPYYSLPESDYARFLRQNYYPKSIVVHIHSIPIVGEGIALYAKQDGTLDSIAIPFCGPLDASERIQTIEVWRINKTTNKDTIKINFEPWEYFFTDSYRNSVYEATFDLLLPEKTNSGQNLYESSISLKNTPITKLPSNNILKLAVPEGETFRKNEPLLLKITWKSDFITDNNVETIPLFVQIPEPVKIVSLPEEKAEPSCNGGFGSISVSMSGGRPFISDTGYKIDVKSVYQSPPIVKLMPLAEESYKVEVFRNGKLEYTNNNASPTFKIDSLLAGNYKIVVYDRDGKKDSIYETITQPTPIQGNIVEKSRPLRYYPNGNGGVGELAKGELTVEPIKASHTYKWSGNGQSASGSTFQPKSAGVYKLTINDTKCEKEETITIYEDTLYAPVIVNTLPAYCSASDKGQIIAGHPNESTAGYAFTWEKTNNPTKSGSGLLVEGMMGDYRFCAEHRGCKSCTTTELQALPDISITTTNLKHIDCYGASTGAITVEVTGGRSEYYKVFSGDDNLVLGENKNLSAKNYFIAVYDSLDPVCSAITDWITLTEKPKLTVDTVQEYTTSKLSCYGDTTGWIFLLGEGGTPPYSWSKTPSAFDDYAAVFFDLPADYYSFTVTDSKGCQATAFHRITQPEPLEITRKFAEKSKCFDASNGSVGITITGGTSPYTYEWTNSLKPKTDPTNNTTDTLKNIESGTFQITVTDTNKCSISDHITLEQQEKLQLEISTIDPIHSSYDYGEHKGDVPNGEITLKPSGGVGNYTLDVSKTPTFPLARGEQKTLQSQDTGTYVIRLTDANQCKLDTSVLLSRKEPLKATIRQVQHILCKGDKNGTIKVEVEGGVPPYKYKWIDKSINEEVGTSDILENISTGTYEVIVTDDRSIESKDSFYIGEPKLLKIESLFSEKSLCFEDANGFAGVEIAGGTAPYTYTWTGPKTQETALTKQTTDTLKDIEKGISHITVVDSNGCLIEGDIELLQQEKLQLKLETRNPDYNAYEYGKYQGDIRNGQITLTPSGGVGYYTFEINNSTPFQLARNEQTTLDDLDTGTYTIHLFDTNQCNLQTSISLSRKTSLKATIHQVQHILCNNDKNGTIKVDVEGGVPPYKYEWSTPEKDATSEITDRGTGIYKVTVTDANNQVAAKDSFYLRQPDSLKIVALKADSVSGWGASDGKISATISGGTKPYAFTWVHTNETVQTLTDSLLHIPTGNYTVTVTDSNACSYSANVFVHTPDSLTHQSKISYCTYLASKNGVIPADSNDGKIEVSVFGGVKPYTFEWFEEDTPLQKTVGQTKDTLFGLSGGVYHVRVTDRNGYTVKDTFEVIQRKPLVATLEQTNIVTCNGYTTAALRTSFKDGTPGYYQVTWFKEINGNWDEMLSTTYFSEDTESISNLGAGKYKVEVKDTVCKDVAVYEYEIWQPEILRVEKDVKILTRVDVDDARIEPFILGGREPYTYSWTKNDESFSSDRIIDNLSAGIYIFHVSDSTGCIVTNTTTIVPISDLRIDATVFNRSYRVANQGILTSQDTMPDGKIELVVDGGVPPYTANWNTGDTGMNVTGLAQGNYQVTVSDAVGNTTFADFNVHTKAPLIATVDSIVHVSCYAYSDGLIKASVSGGTPPYSFRWNTAEMDTTPLLTNRYAGIYTILVSDSLGKQSNFSVAITQPDSLIILAERSDVSCFGFQNGTFRLVPIGGTSPYTFTPDETQAVWQTQGLSWTVSQSNMIETKNTLTVENLYRGLYQVNVSDQKGCAQEVQIELHQPDSFYLTHLLKNCDYEGQTIERNAQILNNGSIHITPHGGVSPYSFQWANSTSTDPILTHLRGGNYKVMARDKNNCLIEQDFVIQQPEPLQVSIRETQAIACFGETGKLSVASISGGIPPYRIRWNTGDTTAEIQNIPTGTYTVQIFDSLNVEASAKYVLSQPSALRIDSTLFESPLCFGQYNGRIALSVSGGRSPYRYAWNTGATSSTLNNLSVEPYTITVTDANNCVSQKTYILTQPDPFELLYAIKDCDYEGQTIERNAQILNNGSIHLSPQGGIAPYTFRWINSTSVDSMLTDLRGGDYNVQVRDHNNCLIEQRFFVRQPNPLQTTISLNQDVSCFGGAGKLSAGFISGGIPPYRILWNTGDTTPEIQSLEAGTYTLHIFDSLNIEATARYIIAQPQALRVESSSETPRCFGESNGSLTVSVSGGRFPYLYAWNTGAITPTVGNLSASTYSITITDANNCVSHKTYTLTQPELLKINADILNPVCYGDSNGSIDVQPFGGTQPYTYLWHNNPNPDSILTGLPENTYHLRVSDSRFCVFDTNFSIIYPQKLVIQNIEHNKVLCDKQYYQPNPQPDTLSYQWTSESGFFSEERTPQLYSGVYVVRAFNQHECSAVDTITITDVLDTVMAQYWHSSDIYKDELTTVVHVSSPAPDSTLWIIPENVEIVEIGYEYADLIFRDTGLHVIGLITYKGICSDYAETEFVVYSDTGMQQAKKALSVFDYVMTSPNPTADFFDLTLKTRTDADLLIRIFNADNHKPIQILKRNAKAGQLFKETLSVQGYAKGIYILTVQSETEIKVLKIVVI